MKKLVKILAIVMVCALALTALVACDPKPNTDYDKASANLEKNDYEVEGIKEGEEGAEAVFANALEELSIEDVEAKDVKAVLQGSNDTTKDSIQMIWLKDSSSAKKVYDAAKKLMDDLEKQMKESLDELKKELDQMEAGEEKDAMKAVYDAAKKEVDEYLDNLVIGKSGNVVYMGTKGAIEATK